MNVGRGLIGLGLAGFGVLLLLDQTDAIDAGSVVAEWWPVILIGLGALQLALDRNSIAGSLIIVALGLILLGFTTGAVEGGSLRLAWPIALIAIGVWIVFGRLRSRRAGGDINSFVAFFSNRVEAPAEGFSGGSVAVFFGGTDVDLSGSRPMPGASLSVTALLGRVDVIVPHGWRVTITGTPFFGAWDDTTRRDVVDENAPELTISTLLLLSGLEVRHTDRWARSG